MSTASETIANQEAVQALRLNEFLRPLPEDELLYLIERGECLFVPEGESLFKPGEVVLHMEIVLRGEFRVSMIQAGGNKEVDRLQAGDITGLLPYSRMVEAKADGKALKNSHVLRFHKQYFREMIEQHAALTEALVHHMTSRVRRFTAQQQINEKMLSLGKLSAGLAHELNNPASAIVRSASTLRDHLKLIPNNFKRIIQIKVTPQQVDLLNDVLFNRINQAANMPALTMRQRSEREGELLDWLDDHQAERAEELAENLVEFGFTLEDLETMSEGISGGDLVAVLLWLNDNLNTERMVNEIDEASRRISTLLKSIKSYTYMDQSLDKQTVDIHEGIRNTLVMLDHKVRRNKITVKQEFDPNLPRILGFPGELNQLFTNLIDNALDAMENGGTLTVRTFREKDCINVVVHDTGVGIAPENLNKIFDPFFTTKAVGQGTGFGLDVVMNIVRQHKADLKVTSEPGNTAFTICFSTLFEAPAS